MSGQEAHPDVQSVAEFRAGLVDGQRAAWLAEHLARCQRCGSVPARLDGVTAMLAAAPRPTMPADVTRRLTDVLAAEAAGRAAVTHRESAASQHAGAQPSAVESDRMPTSRNGSARRWGGRRRFAMPRLLLPVAVAACLLLAGGGILLSRIGGPAQGVSSAGSGARPHVGHSTTGFKSSLGTLQPNRVGIRFHNTGTNYQPGTLRAQVSDQIASGANGPATSGAGNSPSSLQTCVSAVTGASQPVFVDSARYQGRPAVIIATSSDVWVASPTCDTRHPHVIAHQRLSG